MNNPLGISPSKGPRITLIYTSELILCSTIYMYDGPVDLTQGHFKVDFTSDRDWVWVVVGVLRTLMT